MCTIYLRKYIYAANSEKFNPNMSIKIKKIIIQKKIKLLKMYNVNKYIKSTKINFSLKIINK